MAFRPPRNWAAAGLAVAAFAVLRLGALARYPLWGDETWTLDVGSHPFARAMRLYADDQTHPPLFYAMLWVWRRIGPDSIAWLRLLPALAGIATAIAVLALAREARFTRRAMILAVVLCAGSGILVEYSAELRDYSLLAFMGTLSLLVWLRARDGVASRAETGMGARTDADAGRVAGGAAPWSGFRMLTIVNGVLAYTHYFGLFVILAEWCDAALWARGKLKATTISAAVSLAVLLPWIAETVERALLTGHRLEVLDWLQRPRVPDLLDFPRAALGTSPWPAVDLVLIVGAGAAVGLWVWRLARRMPFAADPQGTLPVADAPQGQAVRVLVLAVVLPVGVSFVASVIGPRPMWLDRYLIAAVPPMLLLVAGTLDGLAPRRLQATVGLVAFACIPGALTATSLVRAKARPRFDQVVRELVRRDSSTALSVVAGTTLEAGPLRYASSGAGLSGRIQVSVRAPADVPSAAGWYVWSESHPPPGITPPAALIRSGYDVSMPLEFDSARDPVTAVRFSPRSTVGGPRSRGAGHEP